MIDQPRAVVAVPWWFLPVYYGLVVGFVFCAVVLTIVVLVGWFLLVFAWSLIAGVGRRLG